MRSKSYSRILALKQRPYESVRVVNNLSVLLSTSPARSSRYGPQYLSVVPIVFYLMIHRARF